MKIEIGAGARAHDGYVALDINPSNADVVADALRLPFEDGMVEALRAVDVLEHISYRHTREAIREWARVLAFKGELFVQVPDFDEIVRRYILGDKRLNFRNDGPCSGLHGAEWRLLGGHADGKYADEETWRLNAHYSLWNREALVAALMSAGLGVRKVETNDHPNLQVWSVKR